MIVRSMRPDEIEAVLDLLDRSFEDTPREYFRPYFEGDPWFKPEYTRICEDNGQMVSTVQIVRREMRVGCCRVIMGGIANVGTPPEFRGRGYSTETLKDSIQVMKADGMDVSMLYTGINAYYEKLGWSTADLITNTSKLMPSAMAPDVPYTVRGYQVDDAQAVVDIYNEFAACETFSATRTLDFWQNFGIHPSRTTGFDIWVAEDISGKVVAYLIGQKFGETYGIPEMCCLTGHEDSLKALCFAMWQRAKELESKGFTYRLADVDSVNTALETVAEHIEPKEFHYIMLQMLNLQSTFVKILPELEIRSRNLSTNGGIITLSTESDEITLEVAPGSVKIVESPSIASIELTQAQLFDLILGLKMPEFAEENDPVDDILATLFPKQSGVYYAVDGF